MPKTLTIDDAEIPTLPGLATLTAKVAALSDPEPAPTPAATPGK